MARIDLQALGEIQAVEHILLNVARNLHDGAIVDVELVLPHPENQITNSDHGVRTNDGDGG